MTGNSPSYISEAVKHIQNINKCCTNTIGKQ